MPARVAKALRFSEGFAVNRLFCPLTGGSCRVDCVLRDGPRCLLRERLLGARITPEEAEKLKAELQRLLDGITELEENMKELFQRIRKMQEGG